MPFEAVAAIDFDPADCRIYAEGWQSWSPTGVFRPGQRVPVPRTDNIVALGYRWDSPPRGQIQGEGLLAVTDGQATAVFTGPGLPSIRAVSAGASLRIETDGPVTETAYPGGLTQALGAWGEDFAGGLRLRPAPTVWCSWYQYFTGVTAQDIDENLVAMGDLDLPIDVVQIDDGYQSGIGDWLTSSGRFDSLPAAAERIASFGRRPGIWVAPFLVGERSDLARTHPDWLATGIWAGRNWGQDLRVLDVANPAAARYLSEVFTALRGAGFDYFKIDFCYAGALLGLDAYRAGLRLIRDAIGNAYLVGCGAPTLASVGHVDAMRVSADTASHYEPSEGDLSQPGQRSAIANGRARAWQHGRFWVNDPDCLLARPGVDRRAEWAAHVERFGGLRASSDRLTELDEWGLQTTRRLLASAPPAVPFDADQSGSSSSSSPIST